MKPKPFSLQAVLTLRKFETLRTGQQLRLSTQKRLQAKLACQQAQRRVAAAESEYQNLLTGSVSAGAFVRARMNLAHDQQAVTALKTRLQTAHQKEAEARGLVRDALAHQEMLEKLRTREHEQWQCEQERLDEAHSMECYNARQGNAGALAS